ncbi:MAG TPA: alkaline phosphatase family protein [Gemmatimonadales bacterium]|nr:alkaline phosphatase family protein [Gemmatimonadales bacterium]
MTAGLVLLVLLGVIPITGHPDFPAGSLAPPRLVVVVAVDQMRADYLDRWAAQWIGGFRRLRDHGLVFTHGMQDHAVTQTAPGHATILSGRFPARTGIVTNEIGVSDAGAPLVPGPGPGASPRRFIGTTLVDWLRAARPGVRLLSVAGKDRSAILLIGRSRGPVFWYANGRFATSRYYRDALPSWVAAYNRRGWGGALAGRRWDLLLPPGAYAEPDAEVYEGEGEAAAFPHPLPRQPDRAARELGNFPWLDSLTLDFALEGVRALALGREAGTDLLAVGLSATDAIGHRFGPDSREIHDQLLRLDRWLGWFLDSLAVLVPPGRTLVVLTGDHGVTPFPERNRREGRAGGRLGTAMNAIVTGANRRLARRAGTVAPLTASSGLVYGDLSRLRAGGVNTDSLAAALAAELARVEGVAGVYTPAALQGAPPEDSMAARWRRSLPEGFPWLVGAVARPGYIWAGAERSTGHGTPNPDDVLVPIVFLGSGLRAGRVSRPVRTVDIAPTLARLLGVRPREPVDGVVLDEVVGVKRR